MKSEDAKKIIKDAIDKEIEATRWETTCRPLT